MYFSSYTVKRSEDVFKELKTSLCGLNKEEASVRQKQYGLNQIAAVELYWWKILLRQFKSPFIYLLFVAAGLSFWLGEKIDGIMILSFIFINTGLGFVQEYHSEKSLKLLKKFIIRRARVRRDNKDEMIESKELVPGDIVMVETGDLVPADLRFFEVNDLTIDESVLTGESVAMGKKSEPLKKEALQIYQAENLAFSGTHVVSGRGLGVVLATGRNTVIGEVAKLTVETHRESAFEKGIGKFSRFILRMILLILIFLFITNVIIKSPSETNIIELLLFSIALTVSVIPEALPVVTTLSLSRGALQLAKNKVVVKRLAAVEDLGSIEILCTDKTGTITENKLTVANINAADHRKCLFYAALASSFLAEKSREPNNAFDLALWEKLNDEERKKIRQYERFSEIPFDPNRRRNSVLVMENSQKILIVRGAPESVCKVCASVDAKKKQELWQWIAAEGKQGKRVIAIAQKANQLDKKYTEKEEEGVEFVGLISFVDPIKPSAKQVLEQAEELGVIIKILTGDSPDVAGAVAHEVNLIKDPSEVITGEELEQLKDKERYEAVNKYHVFARVSPQQKYQIIELLKKKNEVGFLGEGINDAPALKLANVALVVEGAADIAREASDIVLLKKSLAVIIDGIKDGRQVFSNTVKYLKITLISNFGNFYAIAIASLIIPFLPMLPVQILLLNLFSDFPMIAIALDSVDKMELRRPRTYNIKEVILIAIILGLVSTVFDFIFFVLFFKNEPSVLQTNWFIGSVLTELILIYSVRTHFFFLRAKFPSKILAVLTVVIVCLTVYIPYTSLGNTLFKFTPPSLEHLLIIFGVVLAYFVITETIKIFYYRSTDSHNLKPAIFFIILISLIFLPNITQASFYRDPFVKIYNANYRGEFQEYDNFFAYDPQFKGGVSVTLGDLGVDGVNEIITGPGIGASPIIKVFRLDGSLIREIMVYAQNMDKGVNVAMGDVDGNGQDEIITAPRTGGGPHVRVFNGWGQPKYNMGFYAYDYNFTSGVNIAACDINGDGRDEIITGPGEDSEPRVRVFNYRGTSMNMDYYPFANTDRGGVTVGCANVDGGTEEEIIMAMQSNNENWIKVYKGDKNKTILGFFRGWPAGTRTGLNVAGGDVDGDGYDEVVASVYQSGGPQVKMFEAYGKEVNPGFFAFEEDFLGGVNIAVGQVNNYGRDEVIVAPSKPKPDGRTDLERYVMVDLSEQRLYAYREGYLENTFLVSTGLTGPTPTGSFYVRRKIYSHLYVGPGYYLPNTLWNMEFLPHYYLHGAYWHNNFGHPMSHGCINISYTNAEWLYGWTSVGTQVFVQY